ncbi:hypothetical protein [Erysipelothrix aquatica]|uniref:hypothetical protein n=1 Tax=Erysipelothrix aquatica TaxID=2683714 RepID=UPI00135C03EF|nr:hypothetical protein [Erysipelothrix aquatica]
MIERTAKNGHKIIELNRTEAQRLRWGDICDQCNGDLMDLRYYIPVLDYGVCGECVTNWENTASFFEEELTFEQASINVLRMVNIDYKIEEEKYNDNIRHQEQT